MRQEFSYSKTVSIINDYVDVLANRHEEVHKELMSVKKVVNDNKIDITKHDDTSVTTKNRSISLVYDHFPNKANDGSVTKTRSKSVVEGKRMTNNNQDQIGPKCSDKNNIFEPISEKECSGDLEENLLNISPKNEASTCMKKKKSSKKVSIAENLNCDYSDDNASHHDITDDFDDLVDFEHQKEKEIEHDFQQTILNFCCSVILSILSVLPYISHRYFLLLFLLLILINTFCGY